jgi:hypothetical protein
MTPHEAQIGITTGASMEDQPTTWAASSIDWAVARIFDAGQHAHGFIAVGQVATGFIAIGQSALGVIAIGQVARGGIAIGQASFGIVSVGMVSGGLLGTVALGGVAGRKGAGFVLELLPRLTRQRVLPSTSSAQEIWSSGEPGWLRAMLVRDPNGNAALFDEEGRPLGVKMLPALRATAEGALANESREVLAYASRAGDVLVCERLMEARPPALVERLRYATWAPRFVALAILATAYWLYVGFPLVRALVALD